MILGKLIFLVKKHWLFLVILIIGVFLRVFNPYRWFMYGHDQDLAAWFVKDVVFDRHLRLIGQETSSKGIFIGPLFYYLQIPFYWLFDWDPAGSVWLPVVLGTFSIWSCYFILTKIFTRKVGLIASLIYAFSTLIIFSEREVAPTMPVILWSLWFLYATDLLLKGKQKAYLLLGFLGGLTWHLSLGLALLSPLVVVAQMFSKTKINFKYLFIGATIFVTLLLPLFAFEIRHDFQQSKALVASFTTQKDYATGTSKGLAKMDRVMQLVRKNANMLFLDSVFDISPVWIFYLLVTLSFLIVVKKKIPSQLAIILILWQVLFVLFFTFNSINTSEYYLNGMNVVWLIIVSLAISLLFERSKYLGFLVLAFLVGINILAFVRHKTNDSGYVQRKAIVKFIAKDSRDHSYPCVSVSYITSPGNNLGYRYLFYLEKMHVNQPKSGSPVYTIVFPHSMVDRIDKSFGALGLVLPDYGRYNETQVKESCSGQDSNLTDPVFGFTK